MAIEGTGGWEMMKLLMILPFLLFMSCSSKNTQALEQDTEHSKEMPDTIVDAKLISNVIKTVWFVRQFQNIIAISMNFLSYISNNIK